MFHVSLLKKYVSNPSHVLPKLLQTLDEENALVEPKANFHDFYHWRPWLLFGGGVMLTTNGGLWGGQMEMKNCWRKFGTGGGHEL